MPPTRIRVVTPSCLPLAVARLADGRRTLLAAALQYPPTDLEGFISTTRLATGARADVANAYLQRRPGPKIEFEIEMAIAAGMGFGSRALLVLGLARLEAALAGETLAGAQALAERAGLWPGRAAEAHAFGHGGLVLVDLETGALLRQHSFRPDERRDWVSIRVEPRVPTGVDPDCDEPARDALQTAQPDTATTPLVEQAWAAGLADDLPAFATALTALRDRQPDLGVPRAAVAEQAIATLRASGAVAVAQALTGLAVVGWVRGAAASHEPRKALRAALGATQGTILATRLADQGATVSAPTMMSAYR
jgi:predicted sugar kinase